MKENEIRESLSDRLDIADLKYDISKLTSELEHHRSKVVIFEQTIKAQQEELDVILKDHQKPAIKGEMYK